MQHRAEHEFGFEDNEVFVGLSEGLYRFAVMTGIVGLALTGLGTMATVTGAYGGGLVGPAIIFLGFVALAGALLFMRPRASLIDIATTEGHDVTILLTFLNYLDKAHSRFRIIIAAFLLARLASLLLVRLS